MEENYDVSKDRREFSRFSVELRLKFFDAANNKAGEAQANDISAKGIGIFTNEDIPAESKLEMWLEVPYKEEPLYIKGKVVWSKAVDNNKYRVGISLDRTDLVGVSHILRSIYGKDWL
ncbi:MAG: PilZ domain-containing protein [Candidatus Omnitrophota bacterium]